MANLEEETLSLNTNQSGSVKEKEKPAKEKETDMENNSNFYEKENSNENPKKRYCDELTGEQNSENTTSGYTDSGVYQTNVPKVTRVESLKYVPTYEEKHYPAYVSWVMNTYVNSEDFHKWADDYDVRWEIIGIWCREFCENEIKNNRDHLQDIKGDGSLFFRNVTKHLRNYIKVHYKEYKKSIRGHKVI
jgi:hypothetical protein